MHAVCNPPLPAQGMTGFGCAGFAMPRATAPRQLFVSNACQLPPAVLARIRSSLQRDCPELQFYVDEGPLRAANPVVTERALSACTTAGVAVVVVSPESIRSSWPMHQLSLLLQRWQAREVVLVPVLTAITWQDLAGARQLYDSEPWPAAPSEARPASQVLDTWAADLLLLATLQPISADQDAKLVAGSILQAAIAHLAADTARLLPATRDQTLPRPRSMPSALGLADMPIPRLPVIRTSARTTRAASPTPPPTDPTPTLAAPIPTIPTPPAALTSTTVPTLVAPTPSVPTLVAPIPAVPTLRCPPLAAQPTPFLEPTDYSAASDADSGAESDEDDYDADDDVSDVSSRRSSQNTPRLGIFRQQLPPPPPPVTLHDLGQQCTTRATQERLVAMRSRLLGWDHLETLAAMSDLAVMLGAQRELEAARQLQERVVAGRTALLGPEDAEALVAKNNLAWTLRELGDLAGAEELLSEVVAARARLLGATHPRTLTAKGNLARTRFAMGGDNVREAARLQEELVRELGMALGPQHPNVLLAKRDLARSLRALGVPRRARMMLEDALAGLLQRLGPQHPDVAATRALLAEVSAGGSGAPSCELVD